MTGVGRKRGRKRLSSGTRFGRLVLVERRRIQGRSHWLCRCDCGNDKVIFVGSLIAGCSRSCGCLQRELARQQEMKHGAYCPGGPLSEYYTWCNMMSRCYNPRNREFRWYGQRGISVCDRWRGDFLAFLEDMGRKPLGRYTIERINNDGNYEPSNCCWATAAEQARNSRRALLISIDGRTQCLKDWCNELRLRYGTVYQRIKRSGWSPERALGFLV